MHLKLSLTSRHTKTHIKNKTTTTDFSLSENVSSILNYKKKKQRISNSREIDRFGHSLKQMEAASTMRYRMKKHFRGLSTPVSISPIDSKITQYGYRTLAGVSSKMFLHPIPHGRLAAWLLPGGPVGPPARWAATSNVKEGSGTEEGAQGPLAGEGGLYLDKLLQGPQSS